MGTDLGRRQHDLASRPPDRVDERVGLRGDGGLGELDVEGDHLRAAFAQVVDHGRVNRTSERPAPEVPEARLVDADHDEVRRHPLAPNRKAHVDRLPFEVTEEPQGVGEQPKARHPDPDGAEVGVAQSTRAAPGHRVMGSRPAPSGYKYTYAEHCQRSTKTALT